MVSDVLSMSSSVCDVLDHAVQNGELSQELLELAAKVCPSLSVRDVLTIWFENFRTDRGYLVGLTTDCSGSIEELGIAEPVQEFGPCLRNALLGSSGKDTVLIGFSSLKGGLLQPFIPISSVPNVPRIEFAGLTPLYEAMVRQGLIMLTLWYLAKMQQVVLQGISITITDGISNLGNCNQDEVKKVFSELLRLGFILCGVAIDELEATSKFSDFKKVATELRDMYRDVGVPEKWITSCGASEAEIRHVCGQISSAAIRGSQSKVNHEIVSNAGPSQVQGPGRTKA